MNSGSLSELGSSSIDPNVTPSGAASTDVFDVPQRCMCPFCTGKILVAEPVDAYSEFNLETGVITNWSSAPPSSDAGLTAVSIVGAFTASEVIANEGRDSLVGSSSADLLTGGGGNDSISGGDGADLLHGNVGDDIVDGGAGDDVVLGGQGADSLMGGAGDDYLSGDRGNDKLTGGSGADSFHASAGMGVDVVADFNGAEGDRIKIDNDLTYTVVQKGSDLVIDLGAGNEMILTGVTVASFHSDWIVQA